MSRPGITVGIAFAAATLFPIVPAHAQEVMRTVSVRAGAGGPGEGMITRRSADAYARVLGLSPELKEAVEALHEGYVAAYQDAQRTQRESIEKVRREAEETEDHSLFMNRMPEIQRTFRSAAQRLEREFLTDVRAAAGEHATEEAWARVERMRRREVGLRGGGMSGEGVDLVDVVEALKLSPEAVAAVAPSLGEYEAEVDRPVQAKLRLQDEQRDMFGPGVDPEKMQKVMAEARDLGTRIRDVNIRHQKRIEGLLPEDARDRFAAEFRRRCFPAVYRPSRATRELDAALKFDDLDASQRESISGLMESYQRDLRAANDVWASAIEEQEKSGQSSAFAVGGARILTLTGDEPEALKAARQNRRDLDKRTRDRLSGILSPAQRERLPKEQQDEGEWGQMGQVLIVGDR